MYYFTHANAYVPNIYRCKNCFTSPWFFLRTMEEELKEGDMVTVLVTSVDVSPPWLMTGGSSSHRCFYLGGWCFSPCWGPGRARYGWDYLNPTRLVPFGVHSVATVYIRVQPQVGSFRFAAGNCKLTSSHEVATVPSQYDVEPPGSSREGFWKKQGVDGTAQTYRTNDRKT